jgi:hypothetical protein
MIIVFVAGWLALLALCSWSVWLALAVHFITVALLSLPFFNGLLSLRSSALADAVVGQLLRVSLAPDAADRVSRMSGDTQEIFACEPHGQLPLHLYFFAAFGSRLPLAVGRRCAVMGHAIIGVIPFVSQLCQLCGVIFSFRTTVDAALECGRSIAFCPSGLRGKAMAMTDDAARDLDAMLGSDDARLPIYVCRRDRCGLFALAARRGLRVTPVLVPRLNSAYLNLYPYQRPFWLFVITAGNDWLVRPFSKVELRFGAPLDPVALKIDGNKPADVEAFFDAYHKELERLAQPDFVIKYY